MLCLQGNNPWTRGEEKNSQASNIQPIAQCCTTDTEERISQLAESLLKPLGNVKTKILLQRA
jgi:hypothetical protein